MICYEVGIEVVEQRASGRLATLIVWAENETGARKTAQRMIRRGYVVGEVEAVVRRWGERLHN